MAKCWRCGKSGPFLPVGRSGLCLECIEESSDAAIRIITMLKSGDLQRKEALDLIDNEVARDMAEKAADSLARSKFNHWSSEVHASVAQLERVRRSASVKILEYNASEEVATVKGSGKVPYATSFTSCTCGDFIARHLPCKHMYRLAADYGGIDFLDYVN